MSGEKSPAAERNYGIDLLRLLSMFMIVVLHILNMGSVYGREVSDTARNADLLLLSFTFSGVDCYALISGFVGYREQKYSRNTVSFIMMWLQVVFYALVISVLLVVTGVWPNEPSLYLSGAMPLLKNTYWYFTAYFGVFLAAPFLNMIVDNVKVTSALPVCVGIVFFFSVLPYKSSIFDLHRGYNAVWLILLYIIGALLKKDEIYRRFKKGWLLVFLLIALAAVNFVIGKGAPRDAQVLEYTDPTVLLNALVLLLLFANLKPGKMAARIAAFMAPATFGVYIIHTHPKVLMYVFPTFFGGFAELPSVLPMLAALGAGLCILVGCILIDKLRIKLVELIRLKKAITWIYGFIHDKTLRLTARIGSAMKKE